MALLVFMLGDSEGGNTSLLIPFMMICFNG